MAVFIYRLFGFGVVPVMVLDQVVEKLPETDILNGQARRLTNETQKVGTGEDCVSFLPVDYLEGRIGFARVEQAVGRRLNFQQGVVDHGVTFYLHVESSMHCHTPGPSTAIEIK